MNEVYVQYGCGWNAPRGWRNFDASPNLRIDHLPLIGPWELDGLFLAVGHFRNGVLLAPATAHNLAEWMVSGREPEALAPFRPDRGDGGGEGS